MAKTRLERICANFGKTPSEFSAEEIEKIKNLLAMMGGDKDPDAIIPSDECFTCSICGEFFENEDSCNAQPVNDGRCCIMCNEKVVVPVRLKNFEK